MCLKFKHKNLLKGFSVKIYFCFVRCCGFMCFELCDMSYIFVKIHIDAVKGGVDV